MMKLTDIREFYTTYEEAVAGLEEAAEVIRYQKLTNDLLEASLAISKKMLDIYQLRIKELEKGEKEDAE